MRIIAVTHEEESALTRAVIAERGRLRHRKSWDRRTRLGKRLTELEARFTEEVTKARGTITAWDKTIIRRIATVTIAVEQMEKELLNGEPINKSELGRMANTLRHLIRELRIGEAAVSRIDDDDDDSPTIAEIAARHQKKELAHE